MKNLKIKKTELFSFVVGISLVLNLFLAGKYRIIGLVGFSGLLITHIVVMSKNNWKLNMKSKLQLSILLNIVFLLMHMIYSLIRGNIYTHTLYAYIQQVMIYSYLLIIVGQKIRHDEIKRIFNVFLFFFIMIVVYLFFTKTYEFSSIFEGQLSAFMLPATCFMLLRKKYKKGSYILLLISAVIIFLGGRRSSLLGIVAFTATYLLWNIITRSKRTYKNYFILVTSMLIILPIIYINLSDPSSNLGAYLNQISREYTGANFFSGRDVIWPYFLQRIKEYPFLGEGIGVPGYLDGARSLSAHNIFIFLLLQTGITGLIIFCYMMYCFWCEYYKNEGYYAKIFGTFIIAILTQQTFSLGLLSGKMALAMISWTLIAYGAQEFKQEKTQQKKLKGY